MTIKQLKYISIDVCVTFHRVGTLCVCVCVCEVVNGRYYGVVLDTRTHTQTRALILCTRTHTRSIYYYLYTNHTHCCSIIIVSWCDGTGVTAADGGDVGVLQTAPADFHQVLRRSRDGRASRRGAELETVTNERK